MPKILVKLFTIVFILSISGYAFSNNADTSLVIGTFKMSKVIDGDTFRFDGMDKSTRLLGIDTEETFKSDDAEQKTNEIAKYWDEFYKSERGDSKMPVKTDSPLGFEAWKWAEEFFKDVEYVRLEKEDNERTIDIYGRYLVYLIAIKKGKEINYNVECVRLGYSPYFNKYGNSKRFHQDFVDAQNYAMEKKLGIWDPFAKHYPDYDERLVWWNKRAEQLDKFDSLYAGKENYFSMASETDFERLADNIGKEVIIFGGISEVLTKKTPYLIRIPHNKEENFEIVVYNEYLKLLDELDIDTKQEYYIYAKGKLEVYNGKYQIVLRDKDQIWME
ncbi:MAG: thermonuclease family protein [Bacteroidetes bacterium]|nr:thermonuclease family protein [Bacteroidota bacterium]